MRLVTARFSQGSASEVGIFGDGDDTAAPDLDFPARPSPEVEVAVEEGEEEVREEARAEERGLEAFPGTLGIFDVVTQSIEAMESIVAGYRMAGNRPDVLIEVPSDSCTAFDFHRADEMIALGRRLTAEALDRAGVADPQG